MCDCYYQSPEGWIFPASIGLTARLDAHRCVAILQSPPRRRQTTRIPKGLPALPPDIGRANSPAPDESWANATNPQDRLGCWCQSVARWERDESVPLAGRWPAIEAALGPGLVPQREGLAGRIRNARLRLGLTQKELARRAGVDVRTVRNSETGACGPGRVTLERLGAILGDSL